MISPSNGTSHTKLASCPSHNVKAILRRAGLRPTRQRIALGSLLFGRGDRHFTPEMLYQEASHAKAAVSLATIYNTLRHFTEVGLLRQIRVSSSKRISIQIHRHIIIFSWKTKNWSTSKTLMCCSKKARHHRQATKSCKLMRSCDYGELMLCVRPQTFEGTSRHDTTHICAIYRQTNSVFHLLLARRVDII